MRSGAKAKPAYSKTANIQTTYEPFDQRHIKMAYRDKVKRDKEGTGGSRRARGESLTKREYGAITSTASFELCHEFFFYSCDKNNSLSVKKTRTMTRK